MKGSTDIPVLVVSEREDDRCAEKKQAATDKTQKCIWVQQVVIVANASIYRSFFYFTNFSMENHWVFSMRFVCESPILEDLYCRVFWGLLRLCWIGRKSFIWVKSFYNLSCVLFKILQLHSLPNRSLIILSGSPLLGSERDYITQKFNSSIRFCCDASFMYRRLFIVMNWNFFWGG